MATAPTFAIPSDNLLVLAAAWSAVLDTSRSASRDRRTSPATDSPPLDFNVMPKTIPSDMINPPR